MKPNLCQLKLFIFDVDGVLTDGRLHFSQEGECCKSFHAQDGLGINLLHRLGIQVALITGRQSAIVQHRAENLGIDLLFQNQKDKTQAFEILLDQLQLTPDEVAYMGDDLIDLPLLTRVGWALAPADANAQLRPFIDFQTQKPGGQGAVREAIDYWLNQCDHMAQLVKTFAQGQAFKTSQ